MKKLLLYVPFSILVPGTLTHAQPLKTRLDQKAGAIEQKVIEWRRDIHEHPELGNRELRTAEKVATNLMSLGIEVKTGVALKCCLLPTNNNLGFNWECYASQLVCPH